MRVNAVIPTSAVRILALSLLPLLSACSLVYSQIGETCNSHAYLQVPLADHISARFHSGAPVRMAIVPFSVPANLASYSNQQPGLENILAWKVHQNLLEAGVVPIVEILNRQDWPGKKEEFFTGNFGALTIAQEAGYDLVLVGSMENMTSLDTMVAYTKIIEVESGMTLWYGKTSATTRRKDFDDSLAIFKMGNTRPDMIYTQPLIDKLAWCIAQGALSEQPVP